MSSNAYFAELRPDPVLRRIVQWSGTALAVAGLLVILTLDLSLAPRIAAGVLWLVASFFQLCNLRRGWAACGALRVHADGSVRVLGPDGDWREGRLEADGMVLQRWGWIRLRTPPGQAFAEPLRGDPREDRDWRRLLVIWRHVGAVPGSC